MKLKKRKPIYYKSLLYQCINTLIQTVFIFIFLLFVYPKSVYAMTISISNLTSQIDVNQEVEVDLVFDCASCGDISYMRGVFYPSGTNYFGLTKNNSSSWVGLSTDRSLYFAVSKSDFIEASWSGKLKVKPDITDTAFIGTGEYLFKVGRYSSASDSGADWSNELSVRIIGSSPSSSPTQTPTSPSTTQPTQMPTNTPTVKPTPTKTATAKPTLKPTPTESGQIEESTPAVLSLVTSVSSSEPEKNLPAGRQGKSTILAIIFITSGAVFLGYGGYLLYNTKHEIH